MKCFTIKIFCMKFFTNPNSKYIIATLRIVIIGKPELTFFLFLSLHSELFWSALFLIGTEYGKIWEMRENTDYNNFIYRNFYAVYNSMKKRIKKKMTRLTALLKMLMIKTVILFADSFTSRSVSYKSFDKNKYLKKYTVTSINLRNINTEILKSKKAYRVKKICRTQSHCEEVFW